MNWVAGLVTSGAAAFGRILIVNLLPTTVLVLLVLAPISSGAFQPSKKNLTFSDLLPSASEPTDAVRILLMLVAVVCLAAVLQSFQIGFVRILEGYWPTRILNGLIAAGASRQIRRRDRLVRKWDDWEELSRSQTAGQTNEYLDTTVRRMRRQRVAAREAEMVQNELLLYPPEDTDILPTRLGNAMRSGERRAGERYGWETVPAWPRLYPHLSDRVAVAYHSSTDALDASANFAIVFGALTPLQLIAYYNDPRLLWLPLLTAALSLASYRAAVAAASMLLLVQAVAFDLHRFDMMKGLRFPPPASPTTELKYAQLISRFMSLGMDPGDASKYLKRMTYDHPSEK